MTNEVGLLWIDSTQSGEVGRGVGIVFKERIPNKIEVAYTNLQAYMRALLALNLGWMDRLFLKWRQ